MKALYKENHPNKVLCIYAKFLNRCPKSKKVSCDMLQRGLQKRYIL